MSKHDLRIRRRNPNIANLFLNRKTYESLIVKNLSQYHADLRKLLQKHTDIWSSVEKTIGEKLNADTCTGVALTASYEMFLLAREMGMMFSKKLDIHHSK